jgi:tetratricopeptide (TPR) repeat protein
MKNKFFFILMALLSCGACNSNPEKEKSTAPHPALTNPVIKPYTDAISQDSTDPTLYYQRAQMLNKLGIDALTEADLRKAVSLDAQNDEYLESLSAFLIDKNKPGDALQFIKQLQAKHPDAPDYKLLQVDALLGLGNLSEASTLVTSLMQSLPNNPYILLEASKVKAAQKDTATAIAYAQQLTAIAPDFYDGVYHLADLYSEGNNKEAIKWYQTLYKLDTLNAFPFYDLAKFYLKNEDVKTAKMYFKKSILVDRDFVKSYLELGSILMAEDSVDKADRQFQLATEVAPANADAYYGKGLVYERRGNKELAKNFYGQALIFNPDHKDASAALEKLK